MAKNEENRKKELVITPVLVDWKIVSFHMQIGGSKSVTVSRAAADLFGDEDKDKVMSFIAECVTQDAAEPNVNPVDIHYHHFTLQGREVAIAVIFDKDKLPEIIVDTLHNAHLWGQGQSAGPNKN